MQGECAMEDQRWRGCGGQTAKKGIAGVVVAEARPRKARWRRGGARGGECAVAGGTAMAWWAELGIGVVEGDAADAR